MDSRPAGESGLQLIEPFQLSKPFNDEFPRIEVHAAPTKDIRVRISADRASMKLARCQRESARA